MKNQITTEVIDARAEDNLLEIVELEDRLELAAVQADRCNNRCSGNDYPDTILL